MATTLQLLLSEVLTPDEVISWLLQKETDIEKIQGLDRERADFIPYFLNYLRDQSNKLLQSSQTSGLTPVKTFSLNPRKNVQRVPNHRSRVSPRVELFPPVINEPTQKGTKKQHSVKNTQTNVELRSEQKLCLGQFLTSSSNTGNQRKRATLHSVNKNDLQCKSSESRQGEIANIDFTDVNDFPPVGNSLMTRKVKTVVNVTNRKDGCKSSSFSTVHKKYLPEERIFCHSVNTMETITACLHKVNFKEKLDILVLLYYNILNENLVPNLSVELYFLVQLLTVRIEPPGISSPRKDTEIIELGSVHNCVYFAVEVFKKYPKILTYLDKSTLRLLADNSRISLFAPQLAQILCANCDHLTNHKTAISINTICSVSFQSETDNRNNFPGDQAFHIFKQQRDLFYESLREWETNHMNSEWSFSACLGDRVRRMVTMWIDPIIYSHLARLFVSQLIAMCRGNVSRDKENMMSTDFPTELLANLKSNPEKLKRLHKRFVTPARVGGPCPPPTFSGVQEFFRDFIVFAGCSMFNQHLIDTLVFKIHELDNTSFNLLEKDLSVDDNLKQHFCSCLFTLRLLGKFLGLITFLPYHTMERLPQGLEEDHVISRSKVPLVINLKEILNKCAINQRVTLTVPWVVEFLSMMDKCGHLLNQVQETLKILIQLYRSEHFRINNEKFRLNRFLVLIVLGWLFETPNFPSSLFFVEIDDDIIDLSYELPLEGSVDSLELIDHHALYLCCPYLSELKVILAEFAAGTGSKTSSIRKITPVVINDKVSKSNKLLQLQLEENFFHNQPTSVKKVIDFVVERMASNIIKHMRKEIVKTVQEKSSSALINFIMCNNIDQIGENKDKLKRKIQELSVDSCVQVKNETDQFAHSYCKNKIEKVIQLLLPEETTTAVATQCSLIAIRLTEEKVTHWMANQVTVVFFADELHIEIEKYEKSKKLGERHKIGLEKNVTRSSQTSYGNKPLPNLSPTIVAINFKAVTRDLYSAGIVPDPIAMDQLISDVRIVFLSVEGDWTTSLKKFLVQLTVEFFCGLVVVQPKLLTDDVLKLLPDLCGQNEQLNIQFPNVICSRTLLFMSSASDSVATWEKFRYFLTFLFQEKLISAQDLEDQCLQVLKQDWTQEILQSFAKCLDGVIKDYKSSTNDGSNEFIELIDWLAWLCNSSINDDVQM